jgi:pyruvate formate lyase activating enzyme
MESRYYIKESDGSVRCNLCPHNCLINNGEKGVCGVRTNRNNTLYSEFYGILSGVSLDPVEKKPLYHFYPGMNILSLGSYGCNLTCSFCQNHNISQVKSGIASAIGARYDISKIIKNAIESPQNCGIAFTYNEPTVWIEYMCDVAFEALSNGLKTAMVTNGYINNRPLKDLTSLIDAFNIDLKAFSNSFYKAHSGATLKPVLDSLLTVKESGKHLEITMLIIEGENDDPVEFVGAVNWITENLGRDTPLHISRYFPRYNMSRASTSDKTLISLADIAAKSLQYVYIGNSQNKRYSDTVCPKCKITITKRSGYSINHINVGGNGECSVCGTQVYRDFIYLQ